MSNFQLEYTLSSKEVYSALAAAKAVPKRGIGQIIRTVLLILVMGIVGYNMTIDANYVKIGFILEAVCIALLALIWLLPIMAYKSAIKFTGGSLQLKAELRPGMISFDDGADIPLDGTSTILDYPNERMFLIYPHGSKDRVYVIPYRVVDFIQFEEFKSTLLTQSPLVYDVVEDRADKDDSTDITGSSDDCQTPDAASFNSQSAGSDSVREHGQPQSDDSYAPDAASPAQDEDEMVGSDYDETSDEADIEDITSGQDGASLNSQSAGSDSVREHGQPQSDGSGTDNAASPAQDEDEVVGPDDSGADKEDNQPEINFESVIMKDVDGDQDMLLSEPEQEADNADIQPDIVAMPLQMEDTAEDITIDDITANMADTPGEPEQDASLDSAAEQEQSSEQADNSDTNDALTDADTQDSASGDSVAVQQEQSLEDISGSDEEQTGDETANVEESHAQDQSGMRAVETEQPVQSEEQPGQPEHEDSNNQSDTIYEDAAVSTDNDVQPDAVSTDTDTAADSGETDSQSAQDNAAAQEPVSNSYLDPHSGDYGGVILSDFNIQISSWDSQSYGSQTDDIFDDSTRNLMNSYLS